jgi:hypothetical protein
LGGNPEHDRRRGAFIERGDEQPATSRPGARLYLRTTFHLDVMAVDERPTSHGERREAVDLWKPGLVVAGDPAAIGFSDMCCFEQW